MEENIMETNDEMMSSGPRADRALENDEKEY